MSENFTDYLKNRDDKRLSNEELALKNKYLGREDEAKKLFDVLTTMRVPQSRFDELGEENKKNIDIMICQSNWQVEKGIQFNLAGKNPEKARELFEWASENAYISQEQLEKLLKNEWFDSIALAYLWRGYALLMLGKYDEACVLLNEVVPYFNKSKKTGRTVYQEREYKLPTALVPLCECLINPTDDNKLRAIKGLEDYICSFKNNTKLCSYLYYFHLKESFQDVYPTKKNIDAVKTINIPASKKGLPPTEYGTRGSIVIFEKGSGCLEVIGSNNVFEDYVENVSRLGDYSAITQLMETYVLDEEQEPDSLIEDCVKLLSQPGIEQSVRHITGYVLEVAKCAKISDDKVILYFDKDVQ